jgi:GNAT superfamily N-acetyltransferase
MKKIALTIASAVAATLVRVLPQLDLAGRPVDQGGEPLRREDAVALSEKLGDLVPVDAFVEHHAHDVGAPGRFEERVAAGDESVDLVAGRPERDYAERVVGPGRAGVGHLVVGFNGEHVGEGPFANPPAGAHPRRLLVGLRQSEADRPEPVEDLGRDICGVGHAMDATGALRQSCYPRPMPALSLRPASAEDAAAVATIWYDGWCDGHLGHVSETLVAVRTPESFRSRAAERVGDTVVAVVAAGSGAGVGHEVAGFVMVVGDEVEQIYVSTDHRGTGVAGVLLAEAERLVAVAGYRQAWLAVVAGNARARRFYERCGWADGGLFDYAAAVSGGTMDVPCHRYVKPV